MPETLPVVKQIAIFGRGVEDAHAEFPGTVRPDSPQSRDSWDRAVTAAEYLHAHPDAVAYPTGEHTFSLAPDAIPDGTESGGITDVMVEHGINRNRIHPIGGRSTYQNWLKLIGVIDPHLPLGIGAHKNHIERIKKIGRRVMPGLVMVDVVADRPEHPVSSKPTINDRLSAAVYGIYMARTKPGDIAKIQRQDEKVQLRVQQAQKLARTVIGFATSMTTKLKTGFHKYF